MFVTICIPLFCLWPSTCPDLHSERPLLPNIHIVCFVDLIPPWTCKELFPYDVKQQTINQIPRVFFALSVLGTTFLNFYFKCSATYLTPLQSQDYDIVFHLILILLLDKGLLYLKYSWNLIFLLFYFFIRAPQISLTLMQSSSCHITLSIACVCS